MVNDYSDMTMIARTWIENCVGILLALKEQSGQIKYVLGSAYIYYNPDFNFRKLRFLNLNFLSAYSQPLRGAQT